ncbi:hypothetical protein CEXT_298151, partial [Caerostris extrusa]
RHGESSKYSLRYEPIAGEHDDQCVNCHLVTMKLCATTHERLARIGRQRNK